MSQYNENIHNENNCYASTDVNGVDLDDLDDSDDSEDSTDSDELCFRCGRGGHYANEYYAKKHVKGYYIK